MPARFAAAILIALGFWSTVEVFARPLARLDTSAARLAQPVRTGMAMIANHGSKPLWVLQVTPVDATSWGGDRLGSGSLAPGARGLLRLGATGQCRFDLRATFANGREVTRFDLDLCQNPDIALSDSDTDTPLPEARAGVTLFRAVNRTGAPVVALHVSPADGPEQGDVLGAWVMGEEMHYTGRAPSGPSCFFDLKSVFSVRGPEAATMSGQNLCETREIALSRGDVMGGLRR
ncbi:MAG: hypothetical protein JNK84_02430 [Phreatobacter sp.]|uniref:hypothetical protein n=1 Tax=Phreatobacter sp. TaxID=1966341 RepID=UPI001A464DDF|nr:hypothetical protein [Phreatobacter sp.]MBL8567919.1 hypothetical protein [Phreatobacter sp.]